MQITFTQRMLSPTFLKPREDKAHRFVSRFSAFPWIAMILCLLAAFSLRAQVEGPGDTIICYYNDFEWDSKVDPPSHFGGGQGEKLSNFEITYEDVPSPAQDAIDYAANIWETTLQSDVPIRVEVSWDSLESTSLASAGPTTLFRDFPGAVNPETWYNVALAESITGRELNDTTMADIMVTVNENINWYFGLDGNTPINRFDMVSVILHEFGHGLGFLSSARKNEEDLGALGFGDFTAVYDVYLENGQEQRLVNEDLFPNPSDTLLEAFTNNNLFFASPLAASVNGGANPQLFAPNDFQAGSSISHLDEFSFRDDEANALMTPRLARAESIHHPGEVTVAMFEQLGWNSVLTARERPQVAQQRLKVFPNPTAGALQIQLPVFENGNHPLLSMADLNGRRILQRKFQVLSAGTFLQLDVSQLPRGAYVLTLSDSKQLYRTLVIRQ